MKPYTINRLLDLTKGMTREGAICEAVCTAERIITRKYNRLLREAGAKEIEIRHDRINKGYYK